MYQARLKVVAEKGPNDLTDKVAYSAVGNLVGFDSNKLTRKGPYIKGATNSADFETYPGYHLR